MNKSEWLGLIRGATESAGTYRTEFDSAIEALAGILERRDIAEAEFDASGRKVILEDEDWRGRVTRTQNPVLKIINECNRDALAYWRDLGLTPAGLKKINESAVKVKAPESALTKALGALNGGA